MENGADKVDGLPLEEETNVSNGILGVEVEEEGIAAASDKLNEEVEEEVFEEAIEDQEQLEQPGTDEGAGFSFKSDSVVFDESGDTGSEVEAFEDASSVPAQVQNAQNTEEVVVSDGAAEAQGISGGESIDKIDEGGTGEDVGRNELNGGKERLIGDHETTKVLECEDADSSKEVELSDDLLANDDDKPELKVVGLGSDQTGGESVDKIEEGGAVEDVGGNNLNGGKESLIGDHESTKVLVHEDADSSKEVELSDELLPKDDGEPELKVVGSGSDETGGESVDKINEGGAVGDVGGNELNAGKENLIGDHESTKVLVREDADSSKNVELSDELLPKDDGEPELKVVGLGSDETGGESVDKIDEGGVVEDVGGNELNGGKESLIADHESTKVLVRDDADSSKEVELSDELVPKDDGETEVKVVGLGSEETELSVEASAEVKEDKDEGVGDLEEKDAAVLDNVNVEQMVSTSVPDNETGTHESNGVMNNNSIAVDSEHSEDTHKLKASPVLTVEDGKATSPDTARASDLDKVENETSKDVHILPVNSRAEDSNVSELLHAAEVANGVSKEITVNKESEKKTESVEEKKTESVEEKKAENGVEEKKAEFGVEEKKAENGVEEKKPDNGLEEKKPENGQKEKKIESGQKEKKIEHSQEEKKSSQKRREKETQPVPKLASSIGKGTTPAPQASRPAGLGRAAPLLEPAPRAVQHPRVNGSQSQMQSQQIYDSSSSDAEEFDETREKLQMIRVKFLRLAHRLGQTPHNVVVAQVLYRLGLAEQLRGRNGGRVGAFSFDRASAMAEQLENAGQEPLDFSCTIMVLGKTGVGKSATINSIFDEVKFNTDAFQLGTKKVQDVEGTVQGIKVRVIDTPGLLPSWSDQHQNEKILHSVKRFIRKNPPDIVLYLDRLDMQSRDFGDMPLLRTITEIFGPSIWFNAIVVLTHAASAPPDGPNGTASTYDMFVTQRSHVVQQAIRQAAGDMRLMNPVSLVENHSACRTNRAGQRVLPNGQVWKPHLLLLSFASKILAEANMLLKLQDSPPGKPFAPRSRAPPLPFLLSSLLQSRPHVKLPEEQLGDEDGLDDDLDDSSDSEEESEYDNLPPFKSLSRTQVSKLTKTHKKAYFEELEYREKLFMKKQLRDEKRRHRFLKKMAAAAKDLPPEYNENEEEEVGGAASVPVPMPDLALPASFDSDNPTHRYRSLEASNQWLVRPVLDSHGWDHDVGYEGINVERLFVVKDRIPISFSGQVTKDKKDANLQMELASSLKHGEGKGTSLGFDMQTVGKDLAYTLRSETRFCNFRRNKATAGLSFTLLGDALSAGLKVEDKLIVNKRFQMVMSGGAMTGRGDVAYGGSLEAQVRDKDYPLGRSLSTLGLSVMDWHGDLAVGCNIQSQVPIGRTTNLIGRANLNNRGAGQVSVRVNSSEQLQIALIGLIPLLRKLWDYPQQGQGQ